MSRIIYFALALLAIGVIVATVVWRAQNSPMGQRAALEDQFMECLPENYDPPRRDEIRQLFSTFWYRYDRGMVEEADAALITRRLEEIIEEGSIEHEDVAYLMAQVGWFTYKLDKHYSPGDTIDHPTLNPEAGMVSFGWDSTTWKDFYEWKKEMIKSGQLEGYELADTLPPEKYR